MTTAAAAEKVHVYGDFEVNEYITAADFKMVDFDKSDLDTAYTQNTSIISYFGSLLGRARRQVANFKTRRDAVMASVSRRVRDDMVKEGKKPTEGAIEAIMRGDKKFLEVSFAANHALEVETTLEALYWAARGRRNDMQFFADKQSAEMASKNHYKGKPTEQ